MKMSIGQAERATGLSQRQIRYCERRGVVHPERTAGGHRLFSPEDVAALQALAHWRRRGYSLREAALRVLPPRTHNMEGVPLPGSAAEAGATSLYPLVGRDQLVRRFDVEEGSWPRHA